LKRCENFEEEIRQDDPVFFSMIRSKRRNLLFMYYAVRFRINNELFLLDHEKYMKKLIEVWLQCMSGS